MSEPTPENIVFGEPLEQEIQLAQKNVASKPPRRVLKLPPFPPLTYTTQFAGMSASPSSSRRRAALTPSQVQHHASGSFFAPVPHGHEEWIFRSTETIPEGSSGSSTGSDPLTTDAGTTPSSSAVECAALPSSRPIPPPPAVTGPIYARPRAYSHTLSTYPSDSAGVYYSSAHRRVPSSPSFRSASLLPHGYFDRPPSPASSICSHSSEPLRHTSLSLSELLAGGPRILMGEYEPEDEEEHARREEMREERRLAMVERHAAILERREQKRVLNSSSLQVGGWIESSAKQYHEW